MASTIEAQPENFPPNGLRQLVVNRDVADKLLPMLAKHGHPGHNPSEAQRLADWRQVLGEDAVAQMAAGPNAFHLVVRNDRESPAVTVDPTGDAAST